MYVRSSNNGRNDVKIPENYSGSAFIRSQNYADMPPPLRTSVPRIDIEPTVSENKEGIHSDPIYNHIQQDSSDTDNQSTDSFSKQPLAESETSIFASLLPRGDLSSHFPFGHGVGGEELLILAVMLLVFLSGNERGDTDSEFLFLLGLLLFAG